MTTNKFSKKEAIGFGWGVMKNNFWFFVGILLISGLVNFIGNIAEIFLKGKPLSIFLFQVIGIIFGIIIEMGLIKICLKFYDQKKPKFSELFLQYPLFFKMLFGRILYGLIVILGLILLIIPGIILSIKFYFFEYFIVDKGLGPIEALKRSWRLTKGAGWNLFLLFLLLGLINFLGTICFLVGLFATIPTAMLATAFVYRKLLSQIETSQIYVQK